MRIGINGTRLVQRASVEAIVEDVRRAHADGFAAYCSPNIPQAASTP